MSDESGIEGFIQARISPSAPRQAKLTVLRFIAFKTIPSAALCFDVALIASASILSGAAYHLVWMGEIGPIHRFFGAGSITAALFSAILMARRSYEPQKLMDFPQQFGEVTKVWLLALLILFIGLFSFKASSIFSRGATLGFITVGWVSLVAARWGFAHLLTGTLLNGRFAQRTTVLLATEDELVGSNALAQMERYGYKLQQVFKLPSSMFSANTCSADLMQIIGDVIKLCSIVEIDCVFILVSWTDFAAARDRLGPLRMLSLPVYLLPDRTVWPILNCQVHNFGPGPAIEVKRAPLNKSEQVCKRALDCTLACLMLILLAPLLVVVAALIKIDGQGPVFFRQTRNGFNGKPFRIVKFRTMSTLEDGPNIRQATKNDPRVTVIGGVLRRTSIDELPQLFNVLAGDMSLVGPRPHASAHNSQYEWLIANYACRHHVRPGLTGWAQVNGFRGETDTLDAMQKRVERDLWYIDNWSMWLDFKILIKTLGVGLQPTAY